MSTSFDFQSIIDRLVSSLASKSEHANILYNSANRRLLDVVAQEEAYLNQNNEYLTRENQWALARNRSSLLTQSLVHNYRPPRKRGATGLLKISADENFSAPPSKIIDIPKYTTFSDGGDVKFVSKNAYNITTADNFIDIEVVQGEYRSSTFIGIGDTFEKISIFNTAIENDVYDLYVNGVKWTYTESLFDHDGTEQVYEIITIGDFLGIQLRFGNDIFGKKIEAGDTIKFEFVETLGEEGDVLSVGIVNTVDSTIYNIDNEVVDLFCTNEDALIGGSTEASLEEIRKNSPRFFQSGDRATTKDDYKTIIDGFSYVLKSNVWGAYETNLDNGVDPWTFIPSEENVVHLAAISTAEDNLTDPQKLLLVTDLNPKKSPTDIIQFETVEFIELVFDVDAFAESSVESLAVVKANIETALSTEYALANRDFEEPIFYSDFIAFVDAVDGVQYHNSAIRFFKTSAFESAYLGTLNLVMYPLSGTSIRVYAKGSSDADFVLIGTGTPAGSITGEPGYDLTGSSVDLSTGQGALVVNSGLTDPFDTYEIKTYYGSTKTNLTLNNRQDIFRYAESNITVERYLTL